MIQLRLWSLEALERSTHHGHAFYLSTIGQLHAIPPLSHTASLQIVTGLVFFWFYSPWLRSSCTSHCILRICQAHLWIQLPHPESISELSVPFPQSVCQHHFRRNPVKVTTSLSQCSNVYFNSFSVNEVAKRCMASNKERASVTGQIGKGDLPECEAIYPGVAISPNMQPKKLA